MEKRSLKSHFIALCRKQSLCSDTASEVYDMFLRRPVHARFAVVFRDPPLERRKCKKKQPGSFSHTTKGTEHGKVGVVKGQEEERGTIVVAFFKE